jgi:hypothetical protein
MSTVPKNLLRLCPCGCNGMVTRWTIRSHKKAEAQAEARASVTPPPKQRRIAHLQADANSFSDHPQPHPPLLESNTVKAQSTLSVRRARSVVSVYMLRGIDLKTILLGR